MNAVTVEDADGGQMTLAEHLAELRMRIIRAGLAVIIGTVIVIAFYDQVLEFLKVPYDNLCDRRGAEFCDSSLNILDPLEGVTVRLRVSFYGGVLLALPVLLWQLWRFIVPALHKNERRYGLGFVVSSVVLFLIGGALAFTTLERALEFLISWSGSGVEATFRIDAYLRLVVLMIFAFGVGFTIPVMLIFLQLLGVLKWRTLLKAWRYAIVGTFVIAAAITPSGDPISLLALSVPLIVLYFVAVLIGWLVQRRRTD